MYASTYIYLNKQRGQENKEEETEKGEKKDIFLGGLAVQGARIVKSNDELAWVTETNGWLWMAACSHLCPYYIPNINTKSHNK